MVFELLAISRPCEWLAPEIERDLAIPKENGELTQLFRSLYFYVYCV